MAALILALVAYLAGGWFAATGLAHLYRDRDSAAARNCLVTGTVAMLVPAGVGVVFAVLYATQKCGDSCFAEAAPIPLGDWADFEDSWQWYAQLGVAALALVLLAGAAALSRTPRPRRAGPLIVVASICWTVWILWMQGGDLLPDEAAIAAAAVIAGILPGALILILDAVARRPSRSLPRLPYWDGSLG